MTHAPAPRIQLLLVDDHNLFRRGLKALLAQDERFDVGCEAGDLGEALRCLAQHQPDVILLDNHLPGVRGVEGIPALKDAAPRARILMLTVSENADDLAAALQAGADGYLLKTVESDQLAETIVKVMDGESVVSPEMLTKLVSAFRTRPQAPPTGSETTPASLEPPRAGLEIPPQRFAPPPKGAPAAARQSRFRAGLGCASLHAQRIALRVGAVEIRLIHIKRG
jgi:two-component system nitrate/nitrite response regulator NarL